MSTTLRLEKDAAANSASDGVPYSRESRSLLERLGESVRKGGMQHWKPFMQLADRAIAARKLDLLNSGDFFTPKGGK